MTVGGNRKQLMILAGLVVVGGYVVWSNLFSGSDGGSSVTNRPQPTATPATVIVPSLASELDPAAARRRESLSRFTEFKAIYKEPKHPIDPMKVDPTLRLDLLAKVQHVEINSLTQRNLFEFGSAPPAPEANTKLPIVPKIQLPVYGPKYQPPAPPPTAPVQPPPPPITFKYYGFSTPRATGKKLAFFLDGEEIIVAAEGETIKRRYKLLKIGVNSVTMEDTEFSSQQTLPLAPDAAT